MASWITPKTNWAILNPDNSKQYFNIEDYERIRGNIQYLQDFGALIYPLTTLQEMMPQDLTSIPIADLINALENNLASIRNNSYGPPVVPKTWVANAVGPTFEDWNRLESLCQSIYNILFWEYTYIPNLQFTLGGDNFE